MRRTAERNFHIHDILNELYTNAQNPEFIVDESDYKLSLDKLFDTSAWGFRETLLIVIVAMRLDPNFRASTGLYKCHPRGIYERPIREFLLEKGIPHRKSAALNVAKATVGLDKTWLAQREPQDVAVELLNIVNYLETDCNNQHRIDCVGTSLLRRFIDISIEVNDLSIEIEPTSDPDYLYYLCEELITQTPDAGNTPQKIVAFLLYNYHICFNTGVYVSGINDSASATSTTSKKPGDINEENPKGHIKKVYEVTVKPFDLARIRDSYDCVSIFNKNNNTNINEIIVLCRKIDCPKNITLSGLNCYLGKYIYKNAIYYYCDIFEWIATILQRMTQDGRILFYLNLNGYIKHPNTAKKVKLLWKKLHEETP